MIEFQVLQTEDRWTIEIEKQRQIFENEIKSLNVRLADAKRQVEEQTEILESKSATLIEKTRNLEENEERAAKLQKEINELKAEMQVGNCKTLNFLWSLIKRLNVWNIQQKVRIILNLNYFSSWKSWSQFESKLYGQESFRKKTSTRRR